MHGSLHSSTTMFLPDCDQIFLPTPYDSQCHSSFHLMQSLENVGFGNIPYPIPAGFDRVKGPCGRVSLMTSPTSGTFTPT